jgi:phenylacetaldehyde dehydrogenase
MNDGQNILEKFYINGDFCHSYDRVYAVLDPADQSVIGYIPDATSADVEAAVEAAYLAFYGYWKAAPAQKRIDLLNRWADQMIVHEDEIVQAFAREGGRRPETLLGGLAGAAKRIRYYASLIGKEAGTTLAAQDDILNYTIREPLGVVAVMVPWNSTINGAVQKIAPALAAGNTVVVRCADEAPWATLLLGKTFEQAGFPTGVVNIIAGNGPEISKQLVAHPKVRCVSFTGSVGVGKQIAQASAASLKRNVLELGGKSPLILFEDTNLEKAADCAVRFAFFCQGHVCCAVSRVYIQRDKVGPFVGLVARQLERYRPVLPTQSLDDGLEPIGPLFNQAQFERVEKYVALGKSLGELVAGGKRVLKPPFDRGFYYEPTVFLFPDDRNLVVREEIFGPVLSIIPFDTEEEVIKSANDSPFGLSAAVWTEDRQRLFRVINRLEVGTVWANTYMQFSDISPWGGFKDSGYGKEFGRESLDAFLQTKAVWLT